MMMSCFHRFSKQTKNRYSYQTRLWVARLSFLSFLCIIAAGCGYAANYIITSSETELAESQFELVSRHIVDDKLDLAISQRGASQALSVVFSNEFPDANQWPNVYYEGYSIIGNALLRTSSVQEISFSPFVTPDQLASFEAFAYDKIESEYSAGVGSSSFGQGVFGFDIFLDAYDKRYHDVNATTTYGSPNTILAPLLQTLTDTSLLMYNGHSNERVGEAIDRMIACGDRAHAVHDDNHIEELQHYIENHDC
mmetsp:Transcript_18150/g.30498  ORF Transcript_18150/g.30498 Transcript_18150/m.30498 type:complete len:252 (+) Transcript_18150:94-849(+)